MPKTGTTTLQNSTKVLCNWLDKWDFPYMGGVNKSGYPQAIKVHDSAPAAEDFLKSVPENKTIWILSAVRFPIDRIMSNWFQNNFCLANSSESGAKLYDQDVTLKAGQNTIGYFKAWERATGIDLLSHEWDFDKKHIFIRGSFDGRPLKVLLLRVEDSAEWEEILSQYFPGLRLIPENQGGSKVYSDEYNKFKEHFYYKEEQLRQILENSAELQFYAPEEISRMAASVRTVPDDVDNVAKMAHEAQWFRTGDGCEPLTYNEAL